MSTPAYTGRHRESQPRQDQREPGRVRRWARLLTRKDSPPAPPALRFPALLAGPRTPRPRTAAAGPGDDVPAPPPALGGRAPARTPRRPDVIA